MLGFCLFSLSFVKFYNNQINRRIKKIVERKLIFNSCNIVITEIA